VIEAQGEVENAIIAYFKSQEQMESLQSAADAAQRAVDVSTAQYEGGQVSFNTVINTLNALISQQDQLASIQGTVATNLVEIYRSLGGGWQVGEDEGPVNIVPADTQEEMLERGKYWKKPFGKK
jgi:outer membrane protein TolC